MHFSRTETLHYDWQYTFGFLADFCRESAWTDGEALFKTHLGADLTDERFWKDAYRVALFPLRSAVEL